MRIVSWNVNSVRARLGRLVALLGRHAPDAVLLQETKTVDETFPFAELASAGYRAEVSGQKGYNGVAILARQPMTQVQRGFPGDPTPEQRRVISAEVAGVRLVNVYVVNGKSPRSESFKVKLAWLEALRRWVGEVFDPAAPLVIAGDFNIAPDDRDVHDPEYWRGRLLCTDEERARLRALLDWGLSDLLRVNDDQPGRFTWWDYRHGAFNKDRGLRIDLALGSAKVAARVSSVQVDRAERDPASAEEKPSDHAPLIVDLAEA